ncbi:disulfide oxidoreductase [candidate division WWE3 bacterium CG_4_9_14_0_2_um_filter_35_11]|uniref:Disulfide oxidoreductase n=1 Tax=candidate division WWE3 bacterium CG_4_9_14_0_2_um_filter_35_11 TaxID=1975077 RepID=A0A2M8ELS9_UNCKA|nr:MAG: disulfide oxidoreductase [candidate division WWE3 bacterium CG10_big_fil_rev_8_21_14_0_10_35_32]PJC23696.1 MAG: disulfide oxidoreductase [candidate division WWE3 bacterium CG_4_9_14_0_2_um_filter_35_11]
MTITKDTNIAELVNLYPKAIEVFTAFGLHCVGCFASAFDTIGEGAQIHGMIDEEIKEMLEEVNVVLNNEKSQDD